MTAPGGGPVLVTGVGGAPGLDLARALLGRGIAVIGCDSDPMAAGLALPGITARVSVPAGAPGYRAWLTGLCRQLRPAALFSAVEAELPDLAALAGELASLGVRTWLPPAAAITACLDKAVFCDILAAAGLPAPRTFLPGQAGDIPAGMALVVKPRRGQGSQGVHYCHTPGQARLLCELIPGALIQERARGREFTADCLVDRDGRAAVALRWRLVVKGGLSMVSCTFADERTAALVRQALAVIGAQGPCCMQGITSDDGQTVLLEANARFAGAFTVSEAAGADLVGQALNGMFGQPVQHSRLAYQPGVRVTRCVQALVTSHDSTAVTERAPAARSPQEVQP